MMQRSVKKKIVQQGCWQGALLDAEAKLKLAKGEVDKLKEVIHLIHEKIKAGDPWPTGK